MGGLESLIWDWARHSRCSPPTPPSCQLDVQIPRNKFVFESYVLAQRCQKLPEILYALTRLEPWELTLLGATTCTAGPWGRPPLPTSRLPLSTPAYVAQ